MKSFRAFIEAKLRDSHIPSIPHVISFREKHEKNSVKEDRSTPIVTGRTHQSWLAEPANKHLVPSSSADSSSLASREHPEHVSNKLSETNKFNPKEKKAIAAYTGHHDGDPDDDISDEQGDWHSYKINHALINNKPIPRHLKATEAGLESAVRSNPIQHRVHVFSGVSFNPLDHVDNKGRMRSPAYISASHDKYTATQYSQPTAQDRNASHIIQFHLKPGDPATHVEKESLKPGEYETVIGKGAILKHIKTETYRSGPGEHPHVYHVHHFSIER